MNNWEEELRAMAWDGFASRLESDTYRVVDVDDLIPFIQSLLKQQREIMIKLWLDNLSTTYEDMLTKFNNAPEPSEEKLSGISFR